MGYSLDLEIQNSHINKYPSLEIGNLSMTTVTSIFRKKHIENKLPLFIILQAQVDQHSAHTQ